MLVGLTLLTSYSRNSTLYILLIITVSAVNVLISLKQICTIIMLNNDLFLLNMIYIYKEKYPYTGLIFGKYNNSSSSR